MQEHPDTEPFVSRNADELKAFVAELHKLKTDIFMEMIEAGQMPLRPGVKRLVGGSVWVALDHTRYKHMSRMTQSRMGVIRRGVHRHEDAHRGV